MFLKPFLSGAFLLQTIGLWSTVLAHNDTQRCLTSTVAPGALIEYKQAQICETTPGVRSFSGYIHIPHSILNGAGGATPYNASMFFWYFESRNDPKTAPLAIYFGGGPGTTSLTGAANANGPCNVNSDSNSTLLNPFSWNNNANVLFIDQPVQVGFSYDALVPSIWDLLTETATPANGKETQNLTTVKGILPSQDAGRAVNTTANAARVVWTFTQIFLQEFPEHASTDDRLSIWSLSYGGHWGPGIMAHFLQQNDRLSNGSIHEPLTSVKRLHLDTLGVLNGCIDAKIEAAFYPEMAFNNTYGLRTVSEETYKESLNDLIKPGGCDDLMKKCRHYAIEDADHAGTNETINSACAEATQFCFQNVQGRYTETSGRNPFDIAHDELISFPPDFIIGFMNQEWVQKELGVPSNFSIGSAPITQSFFGATGDPTLVSIDTISYVASKGVKVALVFGDRDYRCNWLGGEAVSLAMEHPSSAGFRAAGYAPISVNSSYQGGVVRQHNKISFSRIFDAGHSVGDYQPETVSEIFDRVMFDRDVATGNISITGNGNYSTKGPESSFGIKNTLPLSPKNECYLWSVPFTCTEDEQLALANGSAVVKDFILTDITP